LNSRPNRLRCIRHLRLHETPNLGVHGTGSRPNAKEIVALKADISNDIAGRRVVAEARTDIAQIKATMGEFRERIDRLESHEDGRKHA
jgi:hypothetical protein